MQNNYLNITGGCSHETATEVYTISCHANISLTLPTLLDATYSIEDSYCLSSAHPQCLQEILLHRRYHDFHLLHTLHCGLQFEDSHNCIQEKNLRNHLQ